MKHDSRLAICAAVFGAMTFTIVPGASAQSLFHAPLPPAEEPRSEPAGEPAPAAAPPAAEDPKKSEGGTGTASGSENATKNTATDRPAPKNPQAPSLLQVSLFAVEPVKPRQYVLHDKVEVIINESTSSKLEQKLDTTKSNDLRMQLRQFPSLRALLKEATLGDGIGGNGPDIGIGGNSSFKGDGSAERRDRLTARISGLVKEIKPNGLMLVEARETITQDSETKSLVLSGLVDPRDVTQQNTVQSSQLANLVIKMEHSGEVKDAASKNWLTRVGDAIFGP
jgi:flagellar L-ring protein precursor FlgH